MNRASLMKRLFHTFRVSANGADASLRYAAQALNVDEVTNADEMRGDTLFYAVPQRFPSKETSWWTRAAPALPAGERPRSPPHRPAS
jgi:hypothetical protein